MLSKRVELTHGISNRGPTSKSEEAVWAQSRLKRSSQVMQLKAHPRRTGWQLRQPCGGTRNFRQEVDPFVPHHTRIEIDRFPTVSALTVAVV